MLTSGNNDAEGPQEAHHDGAGGVGTDHDKGEAIYGGHASDGNVGEEDPGGPKSNEDNHGARNLPGDEQSIRGESRASHGLGVCKEPQEQGSSGVN